MKQIIHQLCIFSFLVILSFPVFGQKKYIEEAIAKNRKSKQYYVAIVPEKKALSPETIQKYCKGKYQLGYMALLK